jgi:hypothetical protein
VHRPLIAAALATIVTAGLALVVPSVASAGGGPVTYPYPSASCPSDAGHDLQDCIDAAAPGDIIQLVAEVLDDETAFITKSLTLTGSGPKPFPRIKGIFIGDGGPASSIEVTVRDLRLISRLRVGLAEGSDHRVSIDRVSVGIGSTEANVEIRADVPAHVSLRRSRLHGADLEQEPVLGLAATDPDGMVRFDIVGNTIDAQGDPQSNSGIELRAGGDGTVQTAIHNNVIHHVGTCNCGAAAGITVLPDGPIRALVDVVANTIHGLKVSGVSQRNDLTGAGHLTLRVLGNILSHVVLGIRLEAGAPGSLSYLGGHNDVFASGGVSLDGKPAGAGNVAVDPRFVKPGQNDLRLRADSPVIDRMPFCPPTGVEQPDAAGRSRLAGALIDLGAFERGAAPAPGVARTGGSGPDLLVGTSGPDILCGLGGGDELIGKGGADALGGGPGRDLLVGGPGPDRLQADTGNDTLCGRDGTRANDRVDGGAGSDRGTVDAGDRRISVERTGGCPS